LPADPSPAEPSPFVGPSEPSTATPLAVPTDLSSVLLDQLDLGVWALAPEDGTVLSVNRAGATAVGARPDELVGASFLSIVDPPLTIEGWRLLLDHVDGDRRHHVRVGLGTRHGHAVTTDLDVGRHRTVQTDVVSVSSRSVAEHPDVGTPATDAPLADAGAERFRRTIEALRDGIAVVDASGRIDQVNDSFCRLVGRTEAQIRHRSVFDPPWVFRDTGDRATTPEESAAVMCLRTGQPAIGPVWSTALSRTERSYTRMTAHPVPGGAIVVLEDLSAEVGLAHRIDSLRDTDELTGLGTRRSTYAHLAAALAEEDDVPVRVGVLHVDLDNFRMVNETFGPSVGDVVLSQMADRVRDLSDRHPEGGRLHIGRVGVDEFLLVIVGSGPSLAFDVELRRIADEVQRRLQPPITVDGLEIRLTASIGVARSPVDARDAERLLGAAERALTAGRLEGRNRLRFYEPELDAATRTGLALDRDLRRAAAARQLEVHYQPIIDLRTGSVAMAEALVRWHHPEEGPIPPSVFIPTAEATGAISAVSDLVLSTVARDVAGWSRDRILPPRARIAVNISPTEFEQRDFTDRLAATLADEGVSPSQLELEITESLLVQDLRAAAARLELLDDLGFLIALDDFGTGYSSLSYLHTLPFHTLKIDRRFVGDLRDDRSGTITRAILTLAHNLGIVAVAEGVETDGQRTFLSEAGCDLVQGFLYAPPMPRVAFERFLTAHGGVAPDLDDAVAGQR
jgi:diguanylate cyclase (GGDEF)-like protein